MRASPLSGKHLAEIEQASARALEQWLTDSTATEPLQIVRALDRVLLFLKQNGEPTAQARHVSSLAFAFGQQLVRCGWSWQCVSEDGSVNPSVVREDRACLVVDVATQLVNGTLSVSLTELFRALLDGAEMSSPLIQTIASKSDTDATMRLQRDIVARIAHARTVLRMWGSPEELEAVSEHFTHVLLSARTPGWGFEQTHAVWAELGAPFSSDAEEHAAMRSKLWADNVETARTQVVMGYLTLWTSLERDSERERFLTSWVETLLDAPHRAGTPDQLNAVLFALIGFVARDPQAYVQQLAQQRERIGGHPLRPFHVVGPPGPSEAHLPYMRKFSSWEAVSSGIGRVLEALERRPGWRTE